MQRIELVSQVALRRAADGPVVVVQHWQGFTAGRHGMVVIHNGQVRQRHGTAGQVKGWVRLHTAAFDFSCVITDETAREALRMSGFTYGLCAAESCAGQLPIGGLWCAACGRPQPAAVMAGSR